MPTDDHMAATKKDLRDFMERISKQIDDLYDANEKWKEEIILHFDTAVENIKDELKGANKDKLSLHDDKLQKHEERITTLEQRAALAV